MKLKRTNPLARRLVMALMALCTLPALLSAAQGPAGLVGQWNFDDGTGKDLSGNGADAKLGGTKLHALGEEHACLEVKTGEAPMTIAVTSNSQVAVPRGTFSLWVNTGRLGTLSSVLEFDNKAVLLIVYRDHFMTRLRGESKFKYGSSLIDNDWPKYLRRENAFYPEDKAHLGEGEWHHVVMAYDDKAKTLTGWRDGELISRRDISTADPEPLRRDKLTQIQTGATFNGFIDNIRIYNRVLSDEEVKQVFDADKAVYAGRTDAVENKRKLDIYHYQAEDKSLYNAWLQYSKVDAPKSAELLSRVVVEGSNSTVATAGKELEAALKAMVTAPAMLAKPEDGAKVVLGTPETSAWISQQAGALGLDRVKLDGYVIRNLPGPGGPTLVIAAKQPGGVVFGAFDLIRRIQLGQDAGTLDLLENPKMPIRMVNHWSTFRGFPHDDWYGKPTKAAAKEEAKSAAKTTEATGDDAAPEEPADDAAGAASKWSTGRIASIFSWEDLRSGNTKLIRDWARLMASAGWNGISPADINWDNRNNYLEHLDELKTLAGIFRDYGIKLYWTPNYLLALDQNTADKIYGAVPDFGGYLLKLGSEAQDGDPRPAMVNKIADTLKPHGGVALVRAFVYGKYRYSDDDIRDLNPYDVMAKEDGNYRDNVVLLSKGSPLDWDFSAPIPALDGAIQKNMYGSELVIDKAWPVSWVAKWKWWLEQDNYHNGPGSLNKLVSKCLMGVSMISPSPAWATSPLNMVNYYGLGRLAWNPDLTTDEIYTEWAELTFGKDPEVVKNVKAILALSASATNKLSLYRGYRGVWVDLKNPNLVVKKTPHTMGPDGVGVMSPELRKRLLDQYSPGLREIYGDPVRGEEFLATFNFVKLDYKLSSGRSVIQDIFGSQDEGVSQAQQMVPLWKSLAGKIDERRYQYTLDNLTKFVGTAQSHRDKMVAAVEKVTTRKYAETMGDMAVAQTDAPKVKKAPKQGPKAMAAATKAAAKAERTAKRAQTKAAEGGNTQAEAAAPAMPTAEEQAAKLEAKKAARIARRAQKKQTAPAEAEGDAPKTNASTPAAADKPAEEAERPEKPTASAIDNGALSVNVRAYGALADGNTNDAPAIDKAIAACSAAGGGTVRVPAGSYAVGTIHMQSNITLALERDAVLTAMTGSMDALEANANDQGLMDAAYYHFNAAMIRGTDLKNVKIMGPGTLNGAALTKATKVPAGVGDRAISFVTSSNIDIRNLNVEQGGHYAVYLNGCEKVLLDNVTINTKRDGLNLIQSKDVVVANCNINSVRYADGQPAGGDDAIKLGSDLSLGAARLSENIVVRNCVLASGCNALQFGTETAGPFKNIHFENIRILCAGKAGIGITSNDGGVIENVTYKNIAMEQTFLPMFIKVSDVARVPAGTYKRGAIRNIKFENITATDCYSSIRAAEMPSVLWGKPDSPIENIEFKNVAFTVKGGHSATEAAMNPAENDERFPKQVGGLPAYAWYVRHARGVHFTDCNFGFETNDDRPALVIDDGKDARLEACKLQQGKGSTELVANRNASEVQMDRQQAAAL